MPTKRFIIKHLSSFYLVRQLTKADIPCILKICQTNPQYYLHCPPNPSVETIKKDMSALPPRTNKKDKKYIGFWNSNDLVAIMDLILNYPNVDTCFIGLFMMDKKYQNKGIGSQIVQEALTYLKKFYKNARLGYVSTNKQSKNFWIKNGFKANGKKYKQPEYLIKIMEKDLSI